MDEKVQVEEYEEVKEEEDDVVGTKENKREDNIIEQDGN